MMATLYDELGGEPAVDAAVELFYRKMMSDDRVAYFFDDVDMDRQIAKQAAFMTIVFGGPNHYTGRDMREAHEHLIARGLDDSHVDIVISHLGEALRELGVDEALIRRVAALAESVRETF
jgi:hemoglobin